MVSYILLAVDGVWLVLMRLNLCTERHFLRLFNGRSHHPCAALPQKLGFKSVWVHRACRNALLVPLFAVGLLYPLWMVANTGGVLSRADGPLREDDGAPVFFAWVISYML